jgi:hypothetical protein
VGLTITFALVRSTLTGSGPQSNVTDGSARAASKAASVQLSGVPVPTIAAPIRWVHPTAAIKASAPVMNG